MFCCFIQEIDLFVYVPVLKLYSNLSNRIEKSVLKSQDIYTLRQAFRIFRALIESIENAREINI